jgi:hypothetical protein
MSTSICQKYMSARKIDAPLDVGYGSAEAYRGKSYSRPIVHLTRELSRPLYYSTGHHGMARDQLQVIPEPTRPRINSCLLFIIVSSVYITGL